MLLNLTDISNEPLQGQIIRQLRAKILTGELLADDSIPSIRALARDNQVSVITVQRAYEHLEREGLIHSRRGKGFFISNLKPSAKKEMAEKKIIDLLTPIIQTAFSEGLKESDLQEIIDKVIKKNRNI